MKKIIPIIILVILIILSVVGYFCFFKKKSVDAVFKYGIISRETVSYDGIKKVGNVFLVNDDNKYGLLNEDYEEIENVKYDFVQANDSFVLLSFDNKKYFFDKNGKLLNEDKEIKSIDNMYGSDGYYFTYNGKNYTVYNFNNDKVYNGNKSPLYVVGNVLVFDNFIYDMKDKKNISYNEMFDVLDGIVFEGNEGCYVFNYSDGSFSKYNSYGDYKSNSLVKVNNDYYLDYSSCSNGSALVDKDGNKIIDGCYYRYDLELVNKNVYIYDVGSYINIRIGDKTIEASNYRIVGDYIVVDRNGESTIYDIDGDITKLRCNIKESFDDSYVCSDGIYSYFIDKDLEMISDKFSDVVCYTKICAVSNDTGKYALYKDGLLTKFIYYDVYADDDYVFGYNVDSIDVLNVGWAVEVIGGFDIHYQPDSYSDREIIDIIYQYDLSSIKDYIMKDKEFFSLYAKTAINNPNIKDYLGKVLLAFKAVSVNKEYVNERMLLDALEKLSINKVNGLRDSNVAGNYVHGTKEINITSASDRVIMHELMHFVDFNINKNEKDLLLCNGKLAYVSDYESYIYTNKINSCEKIYNDLTFIEEAGAEYYTSLLFNNRVITSYNYATMVYGFFESIYGKDSLRKVFFAADGNYVFYDMLLQCGLSYEEIQDFVGRLYHITKLGEDDGDSYMKVALYIEKIINNKVKVSWYDNSYYKYVIGNLMDEALFVKKIDNYDNYNVQAYLDYLPISIDEIVMKANQDYVLRDHFTSVIVDDGKKYVTFTVYDENNVVNYLVVEYDFKNEKVNNYKLYPYLTEI